MRKIPINSHNNRKITQKTKNNNRKKKNNKNSRTNTPIHVSMCQGLVWGLIYNSDII